MDEFYNSRQPQCGCDCAGRDGPQRGERKRDCKHEILCSQTHVAECEARLFCDVTQRLRCEIKHARCLRDLTYLINLTNQFLAVSAKKEAVIAGFAGHCDSNESELPD